MKIVKFLRPHRMYQPGEKAGFDDAVAEGLIASGIAVDPDKPKEPAAPATPDVSGSDIVGNGTALDEGVHLISGPAMPEEPPAKASRSSKKKT